MTDQDTFTVRLAERDIQFRYPLAGQLIMLRRRVLRLQAQVEGSKDNTEKVKLEAQLIVDTLDLVESLIVNPEDAEFLEQAMLLGKVDHEQVMDVLRMKQEQDKAPRKKATKAVARGRAKR